MFGFTHKLTDTLLYMTHDMVEELLVTTEQAFTETPKDKTEEIAELLLKILWYKQELYNFENDINEQRKQSFQFSVEELYYGFGQFDKYVGIEFHKFSEAARKYGRHIGGVFVYGKTERQNLEIIITSDNVPRTNGLVKIDISPNDKIDATKVSELLEAGFTVGDIYQIDSSNTPLVNAYAKEGKKEIPNTINIEFDPRGIDGIKLALHNLNLRFDHGATLIESEWNQYLGYNIYYDPTLKELNSIKSKIYDPNGLMKKGVRFYELAAKQKNSETSEEERKEFSQLIKERRIERLEVLKKELTKTNINSLEEFQEKHPDIFFEIYKTSLIFDDDTFTISKSPIPVYWDFKSYLHIYLRHCDELQPEGHFKLKTPFAYSQKNIRRILKIAIEKLEDRIQERLSKGLDFRMYGEKTLYFNGNYYSIRIESNGRVDSFYPNEFK
jgi:hypothetical protein